MGQNSSALHVNLGHIHLSPFYTHTHQGNHQLTEAYITETQLWDVLNCRPGRQKMTAQRTRSPPRTHNLGFSKNTQRLIINLLKLT